MEDEDEDDQRGEELLPTVGDDPPPYHELAQASSSQRGIDRVSPDSLVKLACTTPTKERIVSIIKYSLLQRCTLYSNLLSRVDFGAYHVPTIQDPSLRNETTITQAIQYLTEDRLPPLSLCEGSPSLHQQLLDRIDLYDFSIETRTPDLENAIVQQFSRCPDLGLELFVKFATLCYDRDRGHRVTRVSPMGRYLKQRLAYFLPAIMKSKEVRVGIRQKGGDLALERLSRSFGPRWTMKGVLEKPCSTVRVQQ